MTTLLQQYFTVKAKYKEAVLLFRVGDFYETFNDDAKIVSHVLDVMLVLSPTNEDINEQASLPHYWLDDALRKLTKQGYRVAVCEQLEEPKAGPMMRGVTGTFPE